MITAWNSGLSLKLQKEKREERMIQESSQNINDLDRARMLRRQAELLEQKERARARLRQLMALSTDPYYDRYLAQMMKDLESGKATPGQVEQEAARSYQQYRQRMTQTGKTPVQPRQMQIRPAEPAAKSIHRPPLPETAAEPEAFSRKKPQPVAENAHLPAERPQSLAETVKRGGAVESSYPGSSEKSPIEVKVGVHVFSVIGAIFVLAAFVILGYNFLEGLGQGMSLYGIALLTVILPELLFRKRLQSKRAGKIRSIICGIGVGGLYAANSVNYQVLGVINGIEAMVITLLIAAGAVFISRKKDSALIRLISLSGAYLSLLPIREFDSELEFMIIAVILFSINSISFFFPNQKRQKAVNIIHICLSLIFTFVFTGIAWTEEVEAVYLVFYVITSFIFICIASYKSSREKEGGLFPLCCIASGFYIFLLFLIGNFGPGISPEEPEMVLLVHLTAELLMAAVCAVMFLLWEREDGRRWAGLYFAAGNVLLLGSYYVTNGWFLRYVGSSDGMAEACRWPFIFSVLAVLLAAKLAAAHREVRWLDAAAVFWTGFAGLYFCEEPCGLLLAGALFLSSFRIKWFYMYHQFVITIGVLLISHRWCYTFFYNREGMMTGWCYPLGAGILLLLFLLFNHLPGLKTKKQQPYNIISLILMSFYYFGVLTCRSYLFSSVMMVLGGLTILIIFRQRYELEVSRKYLILAGFLTWSVLTGHYETPVIVSILLMIIALGCVWIGFKQRDKAERICGLLLAFFVCFKLVLFDFREVGTSYRVGLFLTAGVCALLISWIYMRLERTMETAVQKDALTAQEEESIESDRNEIKKE